MSVGTVVGLDVGYGQVKVVWSHQSGRGPSEGVYPSGAAPIALADRVGFTADGEAALAGGAVEVLVGAERYASLVEPMSLRHGMSTLHANYTSTSEYIALFYGALTKVGAERVKHLVTGLPARRTPFSWSIFNARQHTSITPVTPARHMSGGR